MVTGRSANPLAGAGASGGCWCGCMASVRLSALGVPMSHVAPSSPVQRPVDAIALRSAADRLAELLNDLNRDGWKLSPSHTLNGPWLVEQIIDGDEPSARALVNDAYGYWQTAEVNVPMPQRRLSLAERLRALAAEVEAL